MILKNILSRRNRKSVERTVYEAIVAQARQPWFYSELAVPDTLEGRFDMITMHMAMVLARLRGTGAAAQQFSQALFDEMFRDMDRSLRELGVGDLSVGKKVRKMAEVFYGRAEAYDDAFAALTANEERPLMDVIARNIYPEGHDDDCVGRLARYQIDARADLETQSVEDILAGVVTFPEISAD